MRSLLAVVPARSASSVSQRSTEPLLGQVWNTAVLQAPQPSCSFATENCSIARSPWRMPFSAGTAQPTGRAESTWPRGCSACATLTACPQALAG